MNLSYFSSDGKLEMLNIDESERKSINIPFTDKQVHDYQMTNTTIIITYTNGYIIVLDRRTNKCLSSLVSKYPCKVISLDDRIVLYYDVEFLRGYISKAYTIWNTKNGNISERVIYFQGPYQNDHYNINIGYFVDKETVLICHSSIGAYLINIRNKDIKRLDIDSVDNIRVFGKMIIHFSVDKIRILNTDTTDTTDTRASNRDTTDTRVSNRNRKISEQDITITISNKDTIISLNLYTLLLCDITYDGDDNIYLLCRIKNYIGLYKYSIQEKNLERISNSTVHTSLDQCMIFSISKDTIIYSACRNILNIVQLKEKSNTIINIDNEGMLDNSIRSKTFSIVYDIEELVKIISKFLNYSIIDIILNIL